MGGPATLSRGGGAVVSREGQEANCVHEWIDMTSGPELKKTYPQAEIQRVEGDYRSYGKFEETRSEEFKRSACVGFVGAIYLV